jgi:hypothetical protein
MIAEYIEHTIKFEELARQEKNEQFKATLLEQAKAYRKPGSRTRDEIESAFSAGSLIKLSRVEARQDHSWGAFEQE